MPTLFRLHLECEGSWREQAGELKFFEEDAGVVDGLPVMATSRNIRIEAMPVAASSVHRPSD